MVVYIVALALLDFLSGSVTGPGVKHNYTRCITGKDGSPVLDGTMYAAILAEFTICTANFMALLLSTERLFAVACPIMYRRNSSVRRSLLIVCCVVLYMFSVSLASLAGVRWRKAPLHVHMNTTVPMIALIVVNIELVVALRRHNKKSQLLLENTETSSGFNSHECKRRERENSLAVTTQLVVTCFVVSLLPYLSFHFVILYFPQYRDQNWVFAGHRTRVFMSFVFLNPALNPLIFNFRLAHFRRALTHVFMSRSRAHLQGIQLISFNSSKRGILNK